jgi:hypothetical protein
MKIPVFLPVTREFGLRDEFAQDCLLQGRVRCEPHLRIRRWRPLVATVHVRRRAGLLLTAPAQVAAKNQSLLHFVGNAPWSDAAMLDKVRELVLPVIERSGPIEAWIIDDTGFPKKGRHSVGVTRQYAVNWVSKITVRWR